MKKYKANGGFYNGYQLSSYGEIVGSEPKIYISEDDDYDYDNYEDYDDYEKYMDDKKMEMDYEAMKNMYPKTCQRIIKYIEEECNRLDYEGSALYDDTVDKELIEIIVERIYEKLNNEEMMTKEVATESELEDVQIEMTNIHDAGLQKNMIKVMLLNDMYNRRCRRCYRRRRGCYPRPPYPYYPPYPRYPYYPRQCRPYGRQPRRRY